MRYGISLEHSFVSTKQTRPAFHPQFGIRCINAIHVMCVCAYEVTTSLLTVFFIAYSFAILCTCMRLQRFEYKF